jgi:hypothetical protein
MALRTVNPWLDHHHRHDTRPSGYWRSARSPDERSDIRDFGSARTILERDADAS